MKNTSLLAADKRPGHQNHQKRQPRPENNHRQTSIAMTDSSNSSLETHFPEVWTAIIGEWVEANARSVNQPANSPINSKYPPLSPKKRSMLLQITPVTLIGNIAVLQTPSKWIKEEVERDLAQPIKDVLADRLEINTTLAISSRDDGGTSSAHDESHSVAGRGDGRDEDYSDSGMGGENPVDRHDATEGESADSTHYRREDNHGDNRYEKGGHRPSSYGENSRNGQDHDFGRSTSRPATASSPSNTSNSEANRATTNNYGKNQSQDFPEYGQRRASSLRGQRPQREQNNAAFSLDEWVDIKEPEAQAAAIANTKRRNEILRQGGIEPQTRPGSTPIRSQGAAEDSEPETLLNKNYTFETFVIGSSNNFANAACRAVAESPAKAYNPLFIWGESGLGKTHLLHAIGHYAKELRPNMRVRYVSSEELTNDFINSIATDTREAFKRRYRNVDMLIVDDIQFLEGKESTQEEFFHTFNALHQANKQIVLSSDRPPKKLTTLEDRLRTRFEGGLTTDVTSPDLETRIAILTKKAQIEGIQLPEDVKQLIANRYDTSIRVLEGALIRVIAYCSLGDEPISLEAAEVALRDINNGTVEVTPQAVIEVVAHYYNLTTDELVGKGRSKRFVQARQIAMYLCRELTDLSLPKLGAAFGGRDHTTVMYAERRIRESLTENKKVFDQVQELTQKIENHARN